MRLLLLVAIVMVAFAANSLLTRLALADGAIGPSTFAAIRTGSGAAALVLLVALRSGSSIRLAPDPFGAAALFLYMAGFSFAYVTLGAAAGALILFGGVQLTMFAGALLAREAIPPRRWAGAAIAMAGLGVLLIPGAGRPDVAGVVLMCAAAVGWGVYSLLGRGARDPLALTARNFAWATPAALALPLLLPDAAEATTPGVALALASGVVASAMGYALWYAVLPRLAATRAAVAQLSVPIIAALLAWPALGEVPDLRFALSAALVLGGIAISLRR
ncbi:MAG: DMT family transporter [Rubricella sp.]